MTLNLGPLAIGISFTTALVFGVWVWRKDVFPTEVTVHLGPMVVWIEWRK